MPADTLASTPAPKRREMCHFVAEDLYRKLYMLFLYKEKYTSLKQLILARGRVPGSRAPSRGEKITHVTKIIPAEGGKSDIPDAGNASGHAAA